MTECQVCQGRAELFLCAEHVTELRANLTRLAQGPYVRSDSGGRLESGGDWYIERRTPGLLDDLADVVLKRTRLGGSGGHRKRGDEIAVPFEPHTGRMVKDKSGEETSVPVLSPQGRADHLLAAATNALSTIVRDLCESRGGQPKTAGGQPSDMAAWLTQHVHAIACDESAGQVWAEVDSLVRQIERAIDRPTRRVWLGDCPDWDERTQRVCGVSLWAPEDALQVRCHRCRTTHDPSRLKLMLFNDLERTKVPWEKILRANKSQPEDRQVNERTLQHWRASGKLPIRGFRRPDGRLVINRHTEDDIELFLWPDVRKLRDAKPQKKPTGAAARRKVG